MPFNCDSRLSRRLLRKDSDAEEDWRQEEKGMTEDEMAGSHHRVNGHEFEQGPGDGEGQGSLAFSLVCCSPWGHKESDTTEQLNNHHHPCPPSWTFPSGNFRLDCMKLSTVTILYQEMAVSCGSTPYFSAGLLTLLWGWGRRRSLPRAAERLPIRAAATPPPRLSFTLPPLDPEAVSPTFSLHQLFPLNTQSSSLTISTCTSRRAPRADPPYAPSSSPVYLLLERQAHVSQRGRIGWLCPPVMPSPQPWGESRHRSVGGLVHPFPLLETQLRPLPSLLLKGTICILHIALSKQWLSAGGQSLCKDGKLRHQ